MRTTPNNPNIRYLLVLAAAVLAYSLFFSAYQIQRHRAFQTSLDLVSVEQPLWNTLHGRFMRTTYYPVTGQEVNRFDHPTSENLFADHFQPSLLVLLLPYALLPRSETLLILVSVSVALGAIPLYRIAMRRFQHPAWGLAFALAYLLLPAIQTNTSHDIHLTNFLPPLLLFALDALESGPAWLWLLFSLLAMGCREDMLLLTGWGMLLLAPSSRRRAAAGLLALGIAAGAVFYIVIIPYFGGQSESTYLSRMLPQGTELSWRGITDVFRQSFYWQTILVNTAAYNLRLGLPLLFLYWLHAPTLLAAAPIILHNSLSWWPAQWNPGAAHYSAPIMPYLLIGTMSGLQVLASRLSKVRPNYKWGSVIGVALFTSIAATHWMAGYTPLAQHFTWPQKTGREARLRAALASMPDDANLSAESRLAGQLARRATLRFFPDTRNADWLLVDAWLGNYPFYASHEGTLQTWQNFIHDSDWETVFADGGLILLRKGNGPPRGIEAAFVPVEDFALRDLRVHFADGIHEIWLTGAEFIPLSPGHFALCTDWAAASSPVTPTIAMLEPLPANAKPLTGLSFYPALFAQPINVRDCSPMLLAGSLPLQLELAVLNAAGQRLSVAILERGAWGAGITQTTSGLVLSQSLP